LRPAEKRASFDAWLAAEVGIPPHEHHRLSPQELTRLKLGWIVRQRQQQHQDSGSTQARAQRTRIKRGQRQQRQQMLQRIRED